jgi:ATP-dependent HslUV protease ATP-binding subunit HslU
VVFYMPGKVEAAPGPDDLTPRQIVVELDRHIVGQAAAKRAVAIALRNRLRRQKLPPAQAEEILPKNILMIGPTGVGKTEIARRLAKLTGSPFLKVEASKFTEVGYVGRDVDSMVRDLVEVAISLVRQERRAQVAGPAAVSARRRLLDLLLPPRPRPGRSSADPTQAAREAEDEASWRRSRETLERRLDGGELEDRMVELTVPAASGAAFKMFTPAGMEEVDLNLKEMMPGLFSDRTRIRKLSVKEARDVLTREEEEKLLDPDQLARDAIERTESSGILFIDEFDKIAGGDRGAGPDVSREGVQRDLLPLVEGTLVNTKHGLVRTDHILFIAAGAFHVSKPSDLIPELQGRFPIRVELTPLTESDFVRIMTEPENALTKQYSALVQSEGAALEFTSDGIAEVAKLAAQVNDRMENIGARRLHTVMSTLLEDFLYELPDRGNGTITVNAALVRERLKRIADDEDLRKYIL